MGGQAFSKLDGTWSVVRLDPGSGLPDWVGAASAFLSITRSADELSIVCEERLVPGDLRGPFAWSVLKLRGPFAFEEVGILAAFAAPLAEAGIPLFALSTADTDYLLVPAGRADEAIARLVEAGHRFEAAVPPA
ncbi:MAG: ACT domain-containing protein [Isosphaeraceae bacterium]